MKKTIRFLSLLLVLVSILSIVSVPASAASGLHISVSSYPTEIKYGNAYGLRGSVSSNCKLTKVRGGILNSSGTVVMSSVDYPNSTCMDIRYAQLNNALLFNKLKVGDYRLVIVATDSRGNTAKWEKAFRVYGDGSLKINMTSVPKVLCQGQNFGLRGTINSNYAITEVKGQIILRGCGCIIQETIDRPYTKSFNVRYGNINNYLEFNRLWPRSYNTSERYILRIIATDASGQTISVDYYFSVKP